MQYKTLFNPWCRLTDQTKVVIVTDELQRNTALSIQNGIGCQCELISAPITTASMEQLKRLGKDDLVIALFSIEAFMAGARTFFSPFSKPKDVSAQYIFIRLDISEKSLIEGLLTPKTLVYEKITEMNRLHTDAVIRVTNHAGTDISFRILPFETCSHAVDKTHDYAFLPPSETSAEVLPHTANGKIVIDVTVGQLYHFGQLLGQFGRVSSPVTLIVENGMITDIIGDAMAAELKEKLFALHPDCRKLVELGQGLSKMSPVGITGVDESIIDTCHFGFGDGGNCGVHLDVIVSCPTIQDE